MSFLLSKGGDLPPGVSASEGGLHPGKGLHPELGLGRPPSDIWDTTGYGQQAGSTHPTGMHTCLS